MFIFNSCSHMDNCPIFIPVFCTSKRQIREALATPFSLILLYLIWRPPSEPSTPYWHFMESKENNLSLEGSLYFQKKKKKIPQLPLQKSNHRAFEASDAISAEKELSGKRIISSFIAIKFWSGISQMLSKMHYFTYLYFLGNASWHTKLKFNHNDSEVRPESASEHKTQDTINGLEMTRVHVSFCYFMLSLSALSKFNTYHYILLHKILPSLLLCR